MDASDFYIVNDVDRPEARHVVQATGDGRECEYLHEELRDWGTMTLSEDAATLADFGFRVKIEHGQAHFRKYLGSFAKYKDGRTRLWQGESYFVLRLKETEDVKK